MSEITQDNLLMDDAERAEQEVAPIENDTVAEDFFSQLD